MNTFLISSAVALALTSTHLAAGPIHTPGAIGPLGGTSVEQLWLAKDNNGKGQGNGKAMGKSHGNAGHGNRGPDRAHGRNEQPGAGKGRDHPASRAGKPDHAGGRSSRRTARLPSTHFTDMETAAAGLPRQSAKRCWVASCRPRLLTGGT